MILLCTLVHIMLSFVYASVLLYLNFILLSKQRIRELLELKLLEITCLSYLLHRHTSGFWFFMVSSTAF